MLIDSISLCNMNSFFNHFVFVFFNIKIPLSLLNQLNDADNLFEFLKYVDNVTVVEGEANGDTPYVYGAWEVDGKMLNNLKNRCH
jgi:hypothetical protein